MIDILSQKSFCPKIATVRPHEVDAILVRLGLTRDDVIVVAAESPDAESFCNVLTPNLPKVV